MTDKSLKKSVTTLEALCLVVGMIIGSGIFLKPGVVLSDAGSPVMSLLAWVAGGVITLASALSVAEIAAAIPKSGGLYTYLEELYGEKYGFLLGWVQTVISYPASVAAQTIAFATYASFFIPMGAWEQRMLALCVLAFIVCMNIIATKFGGIIQTVATVGKLIPVAVIILFGLMKGTAEGMAGNLTVGAGAGFGAAILGTLWAYDGWISVTNMAGELKNPARDLPRVISGGVIFVIAVYAVFNLAVFKVLSPDAIVMSETPAADAAKIMFGSSGAFIVAAGIMISVFGSLNGYVMTGARVPMVMGAKRQLPCSEFLGSINKRFRTPANSLLFEGALAMLYVLSGTFNTLTDMLIFVLWIFFTMGVAGVFVLRRKGIGKPDLYKVPLFPVTPIVGICGGAYIFVSTIMSNPVNSLTGLVITLIGLPVYWFMKKKA